jgi:hypothetical protein
MGAPGVDHQASEDAVTATLVLVLVVVVLAVLGVAGISVSILLSRRHTEQLARRVGKILETIELTPELAAEWLANQTAAPHRVCTPKVRVCADVLGLTGYAHEKYAFCADVLGLTGYAHQK